VLLRRGARLSAALFCLGGALLFAAPLLQAAEEEEVTLGVIRTETRPEAERVLQLLKTGEPFEGVARRYSRASNAQEGGYLGQVRLSDLRPEIRDAVKGVGPRGVTRIVQVPSGYAIFKVLSRAERVEAEGRARARRLRVAAPGGFGLSPRSPGWERWRPCSRVFPSRLTGIRTCGPSARAGFRRSAWGLSRSKTTWPT